MQSHTSLTPKTSADNDEVLVIKRPKNAHKKSSSQPPSPGEWIRETPGTSTGLEAPVHALPAFDFGFASPIMESGPRRSSASSVGPTSRRASLKSSSDIQLSSLRGLGLSNNFAEELADVEAHTQTTHLVSPPKRPSRRNSPRPDRHPSDSSSGSAAPAARTPTPPAGFQSAKGPSAADSPKHQLPADMDIMKEIEDAIRANSADRAMAVEAEAQNKADESSDTLLSSMSSDTIAAIYNNDNSIVGPIDVAAKREGTAPSTESLMTNTLKMPIETIPDSIRSTAIKPPAESNGSVFDAKTRRTSIETANEPKTAASTFRHRHSSLQSVPDPVPEPPPVKAPRRASAYTLHEAPPPTHATQDGAYLDSEKAEKIRRLPKRRLPVAMNYNDLAEMRTPGERALAYARKINALAREENVLTLWTEYMRNSGISRGEFYIYTYG